MSSPISSTRSELDEFKRLVFQQEHHSLRVLDDRVSEISEAEHLGNVLPEALLQARQSSGGELAESLCKPLIEAMTLSVKQDKEPISSALFPILGPAIRLYVGELFRNMTDQLNETIKSATSGKQIKWRIQAKMAGKTYAEYVLLKTQSYRIERIFLIATDSGLPLRHLSREENLDESTELVSGMLVAIRSFAKDSFSQGEDDAGELKRFSFGEKEIYIEVGPKAIVAAVGLGTPPASFHELLSETVEKIHVEEEDAIANWNGDPSAFDHLQPDLAELMIESQGDENGEDKSNPWPIRIFLIVLGLGLGSWLALSFVNNARWESGIEALRSEPGLEVVHAEKAGWNRMSVHLLKDPMAASPTAILERVGCDVERADLEISPFLSLDEPIATERAAVESRIQEETNTQIRTLAARVDSLRDELISRTELEMRALKKEIEALPLTFVGGTSIVGETHREQRRVLVAKLKRFDKLREEAGAPPTTIQVHGLPLIGEYKEGNKAVITRRLQFEHANLLEAGFAANRLRFIRILAPDTGRTGIYVTLSPHSPQNPKLQN